MQNQRRAPWTRAGKGWGLSSLDCEVKGGQRGVWPVTLGGGIPLFPCEDEQAPGAEKSLQVFRRKREHFLKRQVERIAARPIAEDLPPEDTSSLESWRKRQIAEKKVVKTMRLQLTGGERPRRRNIRKEARLHRRQEKRLEQPCWVMVWARAQAKVRAHGLPQAEFAAQDTPAAASSQAHHCHTVSCVHDVWGDTA